MLELGPLSFAWPTMLWLLAGWVTLAAFYVIRVLRQRPLGSIAGLVWTAPDGARPGWLKRHGPALLSLIGLLVWVLAIARPHAMVALPSLRQTLVLALDISGSMRAKDITPDRMTVVRDTAKLFVANQPSHTRIGVVAVAATAALTQTPTDKHEPVVEAIDRLQPQRGTALGSGLAISLAALVPEAAVEVELLIDPQAKPLRRWRDPDPVVIAPGAAPPADPNSSAAIILISDGQSNVGPDTIKAAQLVAKYGVRVFTIGIGTPEGTALEVEGWSMRVKLDESVLKKVAETTQGQYFRATDGSQLSKVYEYLSARLAVEAREPLEISALFAAAGTLLTITGVLLSLAWFRRVL
ncbi:VWA domain-containing protein [soil metagenome]